MRRRKPPAVWQKKQSGVCKDFYGIFDGRATEEDIALMRRVVGDRLQVKASGGIRDYDTVMAMINAGADRIGASASVAVMEDSKTRG